jgi:hypothetical protein
MGWAPEDLLASLDGDRDGAREHLAECEVCQRVADVRLRARDAWKAAIKRDDLVSRAASEVRLAAGLGGAKPRTGRAFALGFAAAAALAIATAAIVGSTREPHAPTAIATPTATATATAPATTTTATAERNVIPPPEPASPIRSIVASLDCVACRADGAPVRAGGLIAPGAAIVVPAGAHVSLGFAFDDGLVDPKAGGDVDGPASVSIDADGTSLRIERGSLRVRAANTVTTMVPSGAKLVAKDAVYTLVVDEHGVARVSVESGHVSLTKTDGERVVLQPGARSSLAPAPRAPEPQPTAAAPASASAAPPSGEASIAAARTLARDGDTDQARVRLEALSQSNDARVARRAAFTLAEIELATGMKDKARERLSELERGPDLALAADAATLHARSFGSASARAEVWARYLATLPPSPYRERAMLDRADALLDAHRTVEALAVIDDVAAAPSLADAQRRQIDRLRLKAREIR